ncbi:MAG: hypothetical protein HYW47_03520 [Deltaproteobacteria bacterium]|nr:hypothetical protein [Deltaproteobacteria bacterium]
MTALAAGSRLKAGMIEGSDYDIYSCEEFQKTFEFVLRHIATPERFHFETILRIQTHEVFPDINVASLTLENFCGKLKASHTGNITEELTTLSAHLIKMLDPQYGHFQTLDANLGSKIKNEPIEIKVFNEKTLYIKIKNFEEAPRKYLELDRYLRKSYNPKKINKVIVDLRDNPGGNIDTLMQVIDLFLSENHKVATIHFKDNLNQEYVTKYSLSIDKPLFILMNHNTASAAEVFAGALKEYKNATLIGSKSFGKIESLTNLGLFQAPIQVNFEAIISFTVGYFSIGESESLSTGLSPDITLENPSIPIEHIIEELNL